MNQTPLAEVPQIIIAGLRNAGKSSTINNLLEKEISIVSPEAGTTTDPVLRRMELGKAGAVALVDTAGIDDQGTLGELRNQKSWSRIHTGDLVLLITRGDQPPMPLEQRLVEEVRKKRKQVILGLTFADKGNHPDKIKWASELPYTPLDNLKKEGFTPLKKQLESSLMNQERELTPVEGMVQEGDTVILVTPIDLAAPKGRLILPQVETIRDLLDRDCTAIVVKERELYQTYHNLKNPPKLVITDSQAFHKVAADIPEGQPLTSFSLLFARKKGDLNLFIQGIRALENLGPHPHALIMESCSHHRQADDIGTVKIPRLFKQLISLESRFTFTRKMPGEEELKEIDVIIHCGGCMQSRKQMEGKLEFFHYQGVPVVNYGFFLAWANGLLPAALEPIPEAMAFWHQ